MRHRKGNRHLGRTSSHVQSMVRNTVVNLFRHERIRTTVKKAKLVRPYAEKMITLGKKGTLHARRLALAFLHSKPAVVKLFRNIAPRYAGRSGGYTRIVRLAESMRPAGSDRVGDFKVPAGVRLGDGTSLAIIELVESEVRPHERRRRAAPEPFRPRRELHKKAEEPAPAAEETTEETIKKTSEDAGRQADGEAAHETTEAAAALRRAQDDGTELVEGAADGADSPASEDASTDDLSDRQAGGQAG